MTGTAFIFPGQASQYVGMAKDFFERLKLVRDMFEEASGVLGFDLADACFNGPDEKLKKTSYTQPAVFVHSCAIDAIIRANGVRPSAAAGHSLGEYSALVSTGALSFSAGVEAIAKRSSSMQKDCDDYPGTMAAIMGMAYDDLVAVLKSIPGVVVPANYNSLDQVVIAGESAAVEKACAALKDSGAKRAIPIPVGGAYHSPLMKRSSDIMKDFIMSEIHLSGFDFPVYSNVSAESVNNSGEFRPLLAMQISSPVLWFPIIKNMYKDGIRRFIEVGPGKILQGLVKRCLPGDEIALDGVDSLDSLESFLGAGVARP